MVPAGLRDEQIRFIPKHLPDDAFVGRMAPVNIRVNLHPRSSQALRKMLKLLARPFDGLGDFLFDFDGTY
jgi:hypothetical protein